MKTLKLKKLSLTLLLLILSIFSISSVRAETYTDATSTGGGNYRFEERRVENLLPYGVTQFTDIGNSSSSLTPDKGEAVFDPQQLNILEVPISSNVKVTSWANLNNHAWTLTTVKTLAADYESKNPGWKVIAAVNGDFFDISGNGPLKYQTSGPVVSNGEYYKTSGGHTSIGFTNNGTANSLIGYKKVQRTQFMQLSIYNENDEVIKKFDVQKINTAPVDNELAVYFGTYDSTHTYKAINVSTRTVPGYFVDEAELALPNSATDFYGKGIISSTTAKLLKKGQFAISTNNKEVQSYLSLGNKIRVQWELIGDYAEATDITGGGGQFLFDGEYIDHNRGATDVLNARHPRTVVGKKADGTIVMMVVDGRQADKGMYGAYGNELAAMMKHYGVVEAYNLDGGGSSTMAIKKDGEFLITNSPSDGRERSDANALLVVAKDPEISYQSVNVTQESFSLVANIKNYNNHDIDKLFVEMNGERYYFNNDIVKFDNLDSNSKYNYQFGYVDSTGLDFYVVTQNTQTTLKKEPIIRKLIIEETETDFIFTIDYDDPDNASSLGSALLMFYGKSTGLINGTRTISKQIIPDTNNLAINFSINLGLGRSRTITMNSPHIEQFITLNKIILKQDNLIIDIYK